MPRNIFADLPDREIVSRDLALMPRCSACKTPDRNPRIPAMFHLAHPFGPCEVYSDRFGGVCGCTHEEAPPDQEDQGA